MEITDTSILDAVRLYASRNGLPSLPDPVREVGSGREGVVYETTDPAVVIKISSTSRGYLLLEYHGHPGVVSVYHLAKVLLPSSDESFVVIWMEYLLATGTEIFEALGIPWNPTGAQYDDELSSISALSKEEIGSLEVLRHPAFSSLRDLLLREPSWPDMRSSQIGLSRTGQVVLFDL